MCLSTIPVRGRKFGLVAYIPAFHGTIPVRGRKRHKNLIRAISHCTIPVRGRKLIAAGTCRAVIGTIPVRGRKQVLVSKPFIPDLYHPRKGAKIDGCPAQSRTFSYHPRKGAKNSASKKMRSFSFANLNSLFSVGCSSMNGTIAAAVIFSLLRLLHGDKNVL